MVGAHTMAQLAVVATANGGFLASSQTQSGSGSGAPFGSVTLQVPVGDFGAALAQAQALGKTTSLSTRATDVTGEYVDPVGSLRSRPVASST